MTQMKAMILAAGRGERMRPLTDTCPKPLLKAGGKALIVWHLERLERAGFKQIIINHAWLGALVEATLGVVAPKSLGITYSPEGEALETAGGIANALPLITDGALSDEPFLVVNGDIWCDFDVGRAVTIAQQMAASDALAHLVMVPNPQQHAAGDFALDAGRISDAAPPVNTPNGAPKFTFSGIGVYRPALFASVTRGDKAKLAPLLRAAMTTHQVSGEFFSGRWEDVGTPERLAALDNELNAPRARNTIVP
jgi:N-acetyl-alpha-D-muramate 1-phosphate uridylyltransferase